MTRALLFLQALLVALACTLLFFTLYQIASRPPLELPDSVPDEPPEMRVSLERGR